MLTANDRHLRDKAQYLGFQASEAHKEAVQIAADILTDSIAAGDTEARQALGINFRGFGTPNGMGTVVSIIEHIEGEQPQFHCEILVATKQNEFACSMDSTETPVGFTTRLLSIIEDDDGQKYAAVLWQKHVGDVVTAEDGGIDEFMDSFKGLSKLTAQAK